MAFIIKSLGTKTIVFSGTTTTLYTVPTGKSALVNNIRLSNGNPSAASPQLKLQVKPSGGTARNIDDVDFTIGQLASRNIEDVITLGQGDEVQLATGSGTTSVTCVLNGLEKE